MISRNAALGMASALALLAGVLIATRRSMGESEERAPAARERGRQERRGRGDTGDTGATAAEELASLGYVDGIVDEDIESSGVVIHERGQAFDGVNFYSSRKQGKAWLVDMQGRPLHLWKGKKTGSWQHVTLLPDGHVLALVKNQSVIRVDQDSQVEWTYTGKVHHDLWVEPDGSVYVLAARPYADEELGEDVVTLEDYIAVLSPRGELVAEIPLLAPIAASPHAPLLERARGLPAHRLYLATQGGGREYDLLHTNHVEVLDGSLAAVNPAFQRGNILFSPRNLHTIMVIDPRTLEIEWAWGSDELGFPHHPTVTGTGTLLVFDNGTQERGSRVLELDPGTGAIVWTYGPVPGFFSYTRGSNQRLPNGNTLITESDTGYVFEVTPAGSVVWQFLNPNVNKDLKLRLSIWRMSRFARDELRFDFGGLDAPGR
jgi:hypothetical protein